MPRDSDIESRRLFLKGSAAAGASLLGLHKLALGAQGSDPGGDAWDAGSLAHVLPAASHDQFLIKCSFNESLNGPPVLQVGDSLVSGVNTDSDGRFWQFHARQLRSDTRYQLRLVGANGRPLCASWPLRTFPDPSASPRQLRILAFTCAGGSPGLDDYRPLAIRHRLFSRAMSFAPEAVIANGDHIYWDLKTLGGKEGDPLGTFNRDEPVYGFENEQILKRVAGPQIVQLYGTRFRSTPVFFLSDDHDYFENDEATDKWVTFPPENLELQLQRATQNLYYPEFLGDPTRPAGLSGASASDRSIGLSECFGTLRYGKLLEVLMYDCGRFVSLKDRFAGVIPPDAERWLLQRTAADDTRHLVHIPSTPFGWSAGKWREWYPDLLENPGAVEGVVGKPRLGTTNPKYLWQRGWFTQHQRIMEALVGQSRPAVAMAGDLHACGWDRLLQSGDLDLRKNAPYMFLHGPVGTQKGWPSVARGVGATSSTLVTMERKVDPVEKNGFSIIDVTPEKMTVRLFAWREPDPVEAIDTLEPFDVVEIRRQS